MLPELKTEVQVWESTKGQFHPFLTHMVMITNDCFFAAGLFLRLQNLAYILAEVYGAGSPPITVAGSHLPGIQSLRAAIKVTPQFVVSF